MNDTPLRLQFAHVHIQPLHAEAPVARNTPQPHALPQLPAGTILQGFVLSRDAKGNPILRTSQGDFQIKSEFFLKTGSDIVIRIEQHPSGSTARILTVDGKTPEEIQQQLLARQPIKQDTVEVRSPQQSPISLQGNTKLSASLAALTSATAQTQPGTLPPSVAAAATSGASAHLSLDALINASAQLTFLTPVRESEIAANIKTLLPLLKGHHQVNAQIQTITLPNASTLAQPPSSHTITEQGKLLLNATVINHDAQARNLLQTPLGTLQLHHNASIPLPIGTSITLAVNSIGSQPVVLPVPASTTPAPPAATNSPPPISIASTPTPPAITTQMPSAIEHIMTTATAQTAQPAASSTPSNLMTLFSELSHRWHSLEDALQHMARAEQVPVGQTAIARIIPNTSSSMVNSVLFYLSALSSGNIRRWLGNSIMDSLEKTASTLPDRLSTEFGGISRLATAPSEHHWQSFLFPLLHDEELHQIRLFLRREQPTDQQQEHTGERFIIEASFSEFGDVQLDGLIRTHNNKLRFDMVMRTANTIGEDIQNDIRDIFNVASEQTGFVGSIAFSESAAHLIHPLETAEFNASGDDRSILA